MTPSLIWKWYLLSETVNSISLRSRLWSSVVGSPSILVLYLSTLLSVEHLMWCLPAPSSSFCLSAVMIHSLRFFVGFSASTDFLHQVFREDLYILLAHISTFPTTQRQESRPVLECKPVEQSRWMWHLVQESPSQSREFPSRCASDWNFPVPSHLRGIFSS